MNETMQAAVYHGPTDLRVEQVPLPEIGAGEALLRVASASICGTDLRIFHGAHRLYPPGTRRIPGHELVGDLVKLGAEVKGLQVGQRVFMAPNMGCGHCNLCVSGRNNLCANYQAVGVTLDGAFAEYMRIPAAAILQGNIIPLGDNLDPAEAALIEPFACVLRGQDAVGVGVGDVVLVVGAGPIGVMHAMLARMRGANQVIVSEMLPERVAQARQLGLEPVVNPGEVDLAGVISQATSDRGADVVIVAAPAHRPQEEALHLASVGGRINFFGGLPKDKSTITLDSNLVHYKELIITGTTACSTDDCRRAAEIFNAGRIDLSGLISARLPLSRAREAFALAEERKALKVVIVPGME